MAATIQINEFNGAGETKTANITNSNLGSVDAVNLSASANPIVAGDNSYEKWQKIEVTALGGSTSIDNLKTWMTGTLSGSDALKSNVRETSYGGAETYATPVATASSIADQTMPTSEPTGANLGIGGSLTGSLTATGSSDYLVMQLQTDAATTAGATLTIHYQYDEVA
jgi:hypothetical protein